MVFANKVILGIKRKKSGIRLRAQKFPKICKITSGRKL